MGWKKRGGPVASRSINFKSKDSMDLDAADRTDDTECMVSAKCADSAKRVDLEDDCKRVDGDDR